MKHFKWPRLLFLDFEFNRVSSENVNLVCCTTLCSETKQLRKFWLHNNPENQEKLRTHLAKYKVLVGYSCVAEARSLYSLNIDPLSTQWFDMFLEYRMLSNHNDKLNWGKQLVDGKVKTVSKPRPKYERTEEDSKTGFRPTCSLAEATYKLTGKIRDTVEKNECRDLIISAPKKFTAEQKQRILDYNAADVEFLPELFEKILDAYEDVLKDEGKTPNWEEYFEEATWRGRYAAHTAIMESLGYPINYEATKNFSNQIPSIIASCQRDINQQFTGPVGRVLAKLQQRDFKDFVPFKWNRATANFTWNQKATRDWLETNGYADRWMRTDTGQLSLSLEAFEKHFQFKHDYPRGNFGAQMVRYLKLKQSLYGFSQSGGKRKSFWDNVGPDKRVRPYMNIYGAQSGRSQPAATGFMFLKPAWMRALVQPAPGYFMAGIDYGQQEFFLAALLSEDENMVAAYMSGDPYLFMAKEAGTIPPEGTKDSHSRERDLMKSTTLAILFMMTKYGLSAKLTADTGREYTEDEAQELIETFEGLFPVFTEWRRDLISQYESMDAEHLVTLDGWKVWRNNDNPRSIGNVLVQGGGAAAMRSAVDLAVGAGCRVLFTLHDANYIEGKMSQLHHIEKLADAMREGFAGFFVGTRFEKEARAIKLDPKAWGPDFPDEGVITVGKLRVPVSKLYVDKRSIEDYKRFSPFFSEPDSSIL